MNLPFGDDIEGVPSCELSDDVLTVCIVDLYLFILK